MIVIAYRLYGITGTQTSFFPGWNLCWLAGCDTGTPECDMHGEAAQTMAGVLTRSEIDVTGLIGTDRIETCVGP